jgi:peptidoglycan hydrolase CwlO-like protein
MLSKLKTYFKSNTELNNKVGKLEHQIELMKEHIQTQNDEKMSLKKQIRDLEMMWDIETTKRY